MHSNKSITWQITDNSVKNRMIDNSLLHTFVSSQKIRKRTKVINAELKKYGVKDYKDYIDLKTNILRYLEEDPDTDDPGYLTDVDYSIIYSSESTQAKYIAERTKKTYNFASDVNYKTYKSKNNTKNTKNTKNIKNTKLKRKDDQREQRKNTEVQNKHRVQRNKSLETKHNTSNKYINIGWQEVIRQRDVSHLSDNRTSTNISNNEKDTSEDEECNFLKTQFNNQSFSQQLTCQSSTLSNTIKSRNRKTKKNNKGSNVMVNKLYSEDNTILNEIKVISENKVQNYEHQNRVLNDLTSDLDSQSSHYSATPSKSTEDINDFNNELNSITQNSEDSIISSKIEVFNESTEQIYGHQDAALNESNAKLELQSPHCKATSSESTENINDFNNELNPITSNSEDGIISSKIEVFDENKEQIYGHQDAALNESNAKLESQSPHCKATPSKSTENNDFNNELNPITSNSEDGIISSKIEVFDESKEQIYRPQDTVLNESKVKSDSQSPHCKVTLSKSTENINDFNDELNSITLEENNSEKLTQANNEHLINTDNCNSYKSKLLKNVRRNLTSVLEEVNFTNNDKNINTDKNIENRLNHDQLHLSTVNSSRHSTPLKKKRINVPKMSNSSPETSSFDQHKDSGFDDDSQDKFFKIEKSNIKSSTSPNVAKKIVSPKHPKKSTNVPDTNDLKDSKEDKNNTHLKIYDDCLLEQDNKEVTDIHSEEEEIKNSSPDKDVELSTINQEGETHFVKVDKLRNIKKQLSLSPKQDHTKDADSKSYGHILEKQDKKTIKSFHEKEEMKNLQLNKDDKDTEISINQEGEQSSKETKESFDEEEVKNSLQLNQVHKDTEISIKEDKMHTVKSESDIQKQSLLSPKKECKNEHSKSNNTLNERDNKEVKEFSEKEGKNFQQLSQIDEDIKISSIKEDKTDIKLKDSCDTKKLHLPKITCTEIINTKYKIINIKTDNFNSDIKKVDNINDTNEYTPLKNNASINRSNVNWQDEVIDVKEINNDTSTVETDNEEENTQKNTRLSLQTQKRLQQQAKLNLVVNSDSSDSDNAEDVTEISRKSINNSDVSHCSENDSLNDESNHACKQIDIISIDISSSEDICSKKTSVSTKDVIKQNATKMKEEIKKKSDKTVLSTKCTYENSSLKSAANKNLLKETRCSENVNNNDEHVEDIERSSLSSPKDTLSEFSLRISESNVSCNNNNSNQFSKDNQSSLDKENMRNKSNQWEHSVRTDDLETSCRSGLDISHYERPYNLQQLVEAQKLLVETLPTSFTLADISDDDEAFILNIPNKVLQYNLQDQFLTIKGDTIKFGKHKYKIMRKKVDTTSCVFATGKERKPYKIVNINEISTVTVRERLPPYLEKSDILASHSNVISTESKSPKINNRQTNKRDLKLKISGHKRKRYTSDFEIKQSAVRKKRLKVSHS
ncbi:putative leucine-rich repeat-containing protein DDB_G0290503 isoform X2 [Linepithema humile]|uniref:putative leucine-rich repeat-containing protein DDB_G0290503 isoform X2 n=1 Tax=Linepithema humile TaxID=83485 RepID=UPI00351F809E